MSNLYNWSKGMPLGIFVDLPPVSDVRDGVQFDAFAKEGTLAAPAAGDVQAGVAVDAGIGTLKIPTEAQVLLGIGFGADGTEFTGELLFNADIAVVVVAPDGIEVEVD